MEAPSRMNHVMNTGCPFVCEVRSFSSRRPTGNTAYRVAFIMQLYCFVACVCAARNHACRLALAMELHQAWRPSSTWSRRH